MRKYMKNYQEWYDQIAGNIENKRFLLSLLRAFNRFMTVIMPMIYLTLLATTYLQEGLGKQVLIYVFIPASGFVILSFLRKKIKEQTRKLAVGCSKHCFEVVDGS